MIVGFIPIRLNSKRVPQKSIRPLAGRPLLQYNLLTMLEVGLDKIYVYCSDESIKELLPPGIDFLKRDPSLDSDSTLGLEVWKHFQSETDADIIVQSHATAPFVSAESIRKGLSKITNDSFESSSSVQVAQTYCWYDNKPLNFSRSKILQTQKLKPILIESGGFYIWQRHVLENENSRISKNHSFVEISETEAIDIDYEDDFALAELIALGMKAKSFQKSR